MLTLIFADQVIIVIPDTLVKHSFVPECLCFQAFAAAQFIPQAFGEKKTSADFIFSEMQSPVIQPVQSAQKIA